MILKPKILVIALYFYRDIIPASLIKWRRDDKASLASHTADVIHAFEEEPESTLVCNGTGTWRLSTKASYPSGSVLPHETFTNWAQPVKLQSPNDIIHSHLRADSVVNILHAWLTFSKAEACCFMPFSAGQWTHLAVDVRIAFIRGVSQMGLTFKFKSLLSFISCRKV